MLSGPNMSKCKELEEPNATFVTAKMAKNIVPKPQIKQIIKCEMKWSLAPLCQSALLHSKTGRAICHFCYRQQLEGRNESLKRGSQTTWSLDPKTKRVQQPPK